MNKLPDGWTDDMTIVVPIGRSLDDIVDYILRATIRRETPNNMVQHLTTEFGLSQGDAELALDRTCGGVVRAATGRRENCPSKEKDPLAWSSFHRCLKEPELTGAIYPQFARPEKRQ
jgi:hypothetical protein